MALSVATQCGKLAGISQTELHSHGFLPRGSIPRLVLSRLKNGAHLVANMHQTHIRHISRQLGTKFPVHSVAAPEKVLEEEELLDGNLDVEEEEPMTPSVDQIQTLLMEVCDESTIAELNLKVGSFKLKMRRDIGEIKGAVPTTPLAVPPPIPSKHMVDSISAVSASPAAKLSKPSALSLTRLSSPTKPMSLIGILEAASDEGLEFVTSPKVGLFRKGRAVKGKAGRALCEEGQSVKEGQVVCYLEQLGTQQPVEAPLSGEVVKILWEDGAPMGYADPLIAIRPSFVGIKKLT
ncbi:hypothetical protein O6H91_04G061100 [Diphasiastrum complanatum]|uniref:Uncharacterized protein n=1 Tax=Diphasiastrum complanatum TaxID=34168 RepID=A0ACC2DX71_DIPCM|nr:hypothetical protein O6H91_04G061100 [Diphasiastrum complanatum]